MHKQLKQKKQEIIEPLEIKIKQTALFSDMMDLVMTSGLKSKRDLQDRNDNQQDALDNLVRQEREKEKDYLGRSMTWIVEQGLETDFIKRRAGVKDLESVEKVSSFLSGIESLHELQQFQMMNSKLDIKDVVDDHKLGREVIYPKISKLNIYRLDGNDKHRNMDDIAKPKSFKKMLQCKSLNSKKWYTDGILNFENL